MGISKVGIGIGVKSAKEWGVEVLKSAKFLTWLIHGVPTVPPSPGTLADLRV